MNAQIITDATLNAAMDAAIATITAPPAAIAKKVKKIVVSLKGKFDTLMFDGKQAPSREAIKKLAPETGIIYQGRNSNKEKCVSCSPLAANVNWMRIAFSQNDSLHDMWVCEDCGRTYPTGKGKKSHDALKEPKK